MKPFPLIILMIVIFGFLLPACGAEEPPATPTSEFSPTTLVEPSGEATPSPVPATATPLPPTPTVLPSPTPMDLMALKGDFETFLHSGGQASEPIKLSENVSLTNHSPRFLQMDTASDLLAYNEQVGAEISIHDCEQDGNTLICQASETNQWLQMVDLAPLTYDEIAFSCDQQGNVEEIAITLSTDSGLLLWEWAAFHNQWLAEADTAVTYTPENRMIINREAGEQIEALFHKAVAIAEPFELLFTGSEQAFLAGDLEEAINIYGELLALPLPDDRRLQIIIYRAEAYHDLGHYAAAIDDYLLAIELAPEDISVLNNLCWNYGITEQPELALPYCEEAVALAPFSLAELDSRGLVYGLLGDYGAAIADFELVLKRLATTSDPEKMHIAQQRFGWVASMAAGDNPFTPEVMADLRGEGDLSESETPSDERTSEGEVPVAEPLTAVEHFNLARDLQEQGDLEAALTHYNSAIDLDPQYEEAFFHRGILYRFLGQPWKAIADYDQVIVLNPENAEVYHLRGLTHGTLEDWEQALADYVRALELNPQDPEVYASRAAAYLVVNQPENALSDLNQAIELGLQRGHLFLARGYLLSESGQTQAAIADIETALVLGLPPDMQVTAEALLDELKQ